MILDVHCHYALCQHRADAIDRFSFESLDSPAMRTGVPVVPTAYDSCNSPRALRRLSWRIARRVLKLPAPGPALDTRLQREYTQHLGAPGPIDRYVLLAFDAVHADDGTRPPLPDSRGAFGSDLYVSNSFVRGLCRQNPRRYLFGASVHPYRADAVTCVDEVFAAGACLLKWIPLHQNIDVVDPRTRAVLVRCAELGLPILVHYGPEFTLTTHVRRFESVAPLLDVLSELRRAGKMPTTIVAHVATPPTPWGDRRSYRRLVEALEGTFADAPLYADVSALVTAGKVGFLRALLRRPSLHRKLLFGSDFPVPPALWRLRRDLGRGYDAVRSTGSWPQQSALAMRQMGMSDAVFHRAARILPHVAFFAGATADSTA